MKPKKVINIVAIVLMVGFAYAAINIAPVLSDEQNSYLGGLVWTNSLDEGLAAAQEQHKPVLVYFWAVWCQYCELFETETLHDSKVNAALSNDFILVAVDLDENREVASRFGVSYPPHELFLDEYGNIITRIPGYVDANTFYSVVSDVSSNYNSNSNSNSNSNTNLNSNSNTDVQVEEAVI
ncbi:MAG: thioredoxin family protein [Methanosarcinaceae archaeon]|nr:thioredoxin family protein [Methanosarcinaceae archaeon]